MIITDILLSRPELLHGAIRILSGQYRTDQDEQFLEKIDKLAGRTLEKSWLYRARASDITYEGRFGQTTCRNLNFTPGLNEIEGQERLREWLPKTMDIYLLAWKETQQDVFVDSAEQILRECDDRAVYRTSGGLPQARENSYVELLPRLTGGLYEVTKSEKHKNMLADLWEFYRHLANGVICATSVGNVRKLVYGILQDDQILHTLLDEEPTKRKIWRD